MIAKYHGILVRVIRIETHRAYIVWRGKLKRINKQELEDTTDANRSD